MDKKEKKFRLFDMNRDGKGVEKEIEGPKNLKNFFKHFGRKFYKLLSVNLIMIIMVLPVIIVCLIYFMGPTMDSSGSILFPSSYAAAFISQNPAADLMLNMNSFQLSVPVYNSYVYYVIAAIALIYVASFGWQNVGSTYLIRGMVRGDPVFIISDYFYAIKKNFRQGFFMGLIDCLVIFVLAVDFMFFYAQPASYLMDVMYVSVIALIIVYYIMRFYMYLQLITFNLKLRKIIKNAFIFTALGIKRNIMAILGIVLIAALNILLIMLLAPLNIILPLVLPLFYFMAVAGFIKVYAAYPIIEKYMIDSAPASDEEKNAPQTE